MSEFVSYLHEVFERLGAVQTRRMFGGHGVYREGLMFGLVADDVLYLKVDAESLPRFAARGCRPFEYGKGDKLTQMSYYSAPGEIFEDPDEAQVWGALAFAAAVRSRASKPGKRAVRTRKKAAGTQ